MGHTIRRNRHKPKRIMQTVNLGKIINLSKEKWRWMSERNVDSLALYSTNSLCLSTWEAPGGKNKNSMIIKSGGIHYKQADIHEVSVNIIGTTAILLNRITLLAVVGGNEVTNPFMVTEVYVQQDDSWKLASLSFTRLLTGLTPAGKRGGFRAISRGKAAFWHTPPLGREKTRGLTECSPLHALGIRCTIHLIDKSLQLCLR